MGQIITLVLLLALTLLYAGKMWPQKPDLLEKAVSWITMHIDNIALGSLIYGVIVIIMTPFTNLGTSADTLILFLANVMIVVMALPFTFEKLAGKYESHINANLLAKTRSIIGKIDQFDKLAGAIAAIIGFLLLFSVLFR